MKTFTRTMRILVVMGTLILTNLSFLTDALGQSTCYTVNGQTDKIIKLSMTSTSATGVDSLGLNYMATTLADVGAIAYSSVSGNDTIWVLNADELYYIANPAASMAVDLQLASEIDASVTEDANAYNAMSFDKNGKLWVVNADEASSNTLYLGVLSRTTGEISTSLTPGGDVIEISGISEGTVTAMEFDPLTNDLYMIVTNGGTKLYRVEFTAGSPYTATAVLVSNMANLQINGLSFTEAGAMIGATQLGKLYRIDQNSGQWYTITTSGFAGQLQALACKSLNVNYIGISGYVFDDANLNDIMDVGESGGNNIDITLFVDTDGDGVHDPNENTIAATAKTNFNGFYDIRVVFNPDSAYVLAVDVTDFPFNTTYFNSFIAVDPTSGSAGDYYPGNDFAYHSNIVITGRVYEDLNKNANMENSEDVDQDNLEDIVVNLFLDDDCDGTANTGEPEQSYTVDKTGEFVFTTQYTGDLTKCSNCKSLKSVAGPSDDAVEREGTVIDEVDSIEIGKDVAAFRFKNIGIKVGDVVVDARIRFFAAGSSSNAIETKVALEYTPDAGAITTGQTSNLSARKNNLTNAISWVIDEAWANADTIFTPNLASAFQQVIDMPGYGSSGNPSFMVLFIDNNDEGRWVRTKNYNGNPYAAKLSIEWTDGTGSNCYFLELDISSKIPTPTITEGNSGYSLTFSTSNDTTVYRYFGVWGQAVPVTWLDFDANKLGPDAAVLNWSTSQEINNDYFTVQHSTNGVDFTDIGVVKGSGNSASAKHYEFIDGNPVMGVNYYRIKQTDFNGSYDYSVIRTVNFGGPVGEITVTPNPAVTNVTVQIPEIITGETTVSVLDMSGKVITTKSVSEDDMNAGTTKIDLSNVRPGAYLITVESLNEIYTNRIIKN